MYERPVIDREALEDLVRCAMAAGVACFTDRARKGEIDPSAPLGDAFGDFPAEFLDMRPALVEALGVTE
jgi:hypothetical protein